MSLDLASKHQCVPFAWCAGELRVAFECAPDEGSLAKLETACGLRISPYVAGARSVRAYMGRLYEGGPRRRTRLTVRARPRPVLQGVHSADPEVWKPLGEMLIARGLVSREVIHIALAVQRRTGHRLGTILIAGRFLSERALLEVLSDQMHVPAVVLAGRPIDDGARELLTLAACVEHRCVPFELGRGLLHVAFDDAPSERDLLELEAACVMRVEPHLATHSDVESYRLQMYGKARPSSTPRLNRFDTCTSTYRAIQQFADILVTREQVSETAVDAALSVQRRTRQRLATVLLARGELTPRAALAVLNEPQQVAEASLAGLRVDDKLAGVLGPEFARRYRCVPFALRTTLLEVAFASCPTERILLELEELCGTAIRPYLARPDDMFEFAVRLYGDAFGEAPRRSRLRSRLVLAVAAGGCGSGSCSSCTAW